MILRKYSHCTSDARPCTDYMYLQELVFFQSSQQNELLNTVVVIREAGCTETYICLQTKFYLILREMLGNVPQACLDVFPLNLPQNQRWCMAFAFVWFAYHSAWSLFEADQILSLDGLRLLCSR